MTYSDFLALRQRLSAPANHSWDEYAALAANAVSPNDITILRSSLRRASAHRPLTPSGDPIWDGDNAGHAALALLTRAGFFDIASDIRQWLIGHQDAGDGIYTTGPHVLSACVVDFGDANSLRVLYEFADGANPNVRLNLDRALEHCADSGVRILTSTRSQQIASILPDSVESATNRQLWVLKTIVDDDRIVAFLRNAVLHGRLYALPSLLMVGDEIEWCYFDKLRPADREEADLLVIAMLENVSRGADPSYCTHPPNLKNWGVLEHEVEQALRCLDEPLSRPHD